MTRERQRLLLIVAIVAFCAWIGWLAFLAFTTSRPTVLSRPQFLVSQYDVTAELTGEPERPASSVKVVRIYKQPNAELAENSSITVFNLPQVTTDDGWNGPGVYILALQKEDGGFRVAPIPRSPGFPGRERPRIYPTTPQTLEQLTEIDRK
jgi:hypothetical protein